MRGSLHCLTGTQHARGRCDDVEACIRVTGVHSYAGIRVIRLPVPLFSDHLNLYGDCLLCVHCIVHAEHVRDQVLSSWSAMVP